MNNGPGAPAGAAPPRRAPALYIVSDRHATQGRPLDVVIGRALAGAARAGAGPGDVAIQLREKDLEARALLELAGPLRVLTARFGAALYVNDRIDVALAAGADGVHLAGNSVTPGEVGVIAPTLSVAVSTHGPAELARVAGAPGAANLHFAVMGPIFDTPSKRSFGAPLGPAALAATGSRPVPVLAIGGVTLENSRACLAAGAAGIACIRALLAARDPEEVAFSFCRAILEHARTH